MSARAAWRLEQLGFKSFRYTPGKADWAASGLPLEGNRANVPKVGDIARRDVPACGVDEKIGVVRDRVRALGWNLCMVVNEQRIVLGILRRKALEGDGDAPAGQVMSIPSTYRPNTETQHVVEMMSERSWHALLVTTSDGELVGIVHREDAERQVGAPGGR